MPFSPLGCPCGEFCAESKRGFDQLNPVRAVRPNLRAWDDLLNFKKNRYPRPNRRGTYGITSFTRLASPEPALIPTLTGGEFPLD